MITFLEPQIFTSKLKSNLKHQCRRINSTLLAAGVSVILREHSLGKLWDILDTKWNKRMELQDNTCQRVGGGRGCLSQLLWECTETEKYWGKVAQRLNMIPNSNIPGDRRLLILPDLKIVRILSKSQKQLSSRAPAAARTSILRWRQLAGKAGNQRTGEEWRI